MPARALVFLLLAGVLAAAPTLEQLAADPQLWPAEVAVTAATRGTVLKDGKPAGMILIGAGRKLAVTGIAAEGVTGRLGGDTVRVPVDKTNLLAGGGAPAAPGVSRPTPAPAIPGGPAGAVPPLNESAAEKKAALAEVMASDPTGAPSAMQRLFDGKLVRYAGGRLQKAELGGARLVALYFSASWCGPCRRFTPELVRAYRELKQQHPEFEVVFVSADRSAGDMLGYMREDAMPWPAVKFEQREQRMMDYAGPGIPCLVLVDANGRVLSDSYVGGDYVGPGKVLLDTRRILAKGI